MSAFSGPVGGTTGWFSFRDGTVIRGVHNGTLASIQWTLFPNTIRSDEDCNVELPAPIGNDGNENDGEENGHDEESEEDDRDLFDEDYDDDDDNCGRTQVDDDDESDLQCE